MDNSYKEFEKEKAEAARDHVKKYLKKVSSELSALPTKGVFPGGKEYLLSKARFNRAQVHEICADLSSENNVKELKKYSN